MNDFVGNRGGAPPGSALYLHLPFCRRRCTYCAFAISTHLQREPEYVLALLRELETRGNGERLQTVYLGGGTPSLLAPPSLAAIFERIGEAFDLSSVEEVTLEANPEDVTAERLEHFSKLGVTRLSLGIQSLNDEELYPLGRGHARETGLRALALANATPMRVSADLILGLPQQSRESFRESLRRVIDSGVGHLSVYMLDLEEGTTLERQVESSRVILPPDESVAELYLDLIEQAGERGIHQYEISNFAREGEESRHNLRYWRRLSYIGAGLGAHSFDGARRFANSRELDQYIELVETKGSAITFEETLNDEEVARERVFLSLRQKRGIAYSELIELKREEGSQWRERGLSEGWLVESEGRVAFTPAGFLLSNEYLSELF
jgi:oxygen-independent coproporphyrinogen-3 oxidase